MLHLGIRLAAVGDNHKALVHKIKQALFPKREWYLHVSRIYRDARRLYGKGPYKDHLWFTMRCDASKDEEIPAFYFGFDPEEYSFGIGYYASHARLMERFRRVTVANPKPMETLARRFQKQDTFSLGGRDYARKKAEHSPLLDPWLNKRWIDLDCTRGHDEIDGSAALADELVEGFRFLVPYYDYFDSLRHIAD